MCRLLDFSLVQDRSERFSAAFKESDRELHSFAALVFSSSHLPSLLWSANFFLAFRAFCHDITHGAVRHGEDKTLSIIQCQD